MSLPVFELRCKLQNYPTGHKGLNGLAAQLAHKAGTHDFTLDENECYAELWMGTHENGSASLLDGTDLQKHIDSDKEYFLGRAMLDHFKGDSSVPFLFKILTARKALQLQIHPNKEQSAKLHEQDAEEFVDTNHKPEIALAITEFEIFAGFKPPKEINRIFADIPELVEIFGASEIPVSSSKDEQTEILKGILRKCFDMKDSSPAYNRLIESKGLNKYTQEKELLKRTNDMYPGDAGGLIVVFLMNYFILKPGEAAYVKEGGIHAWLSGEGMIECMAASDNVLNVGFLPEDQRAKDAFLDGIQYDQNPIDDHHVPVKQYSKASGGTVVYDPPIEEFSILKTELKSGQTEDIDGVAGPGILIVTKGSATLAFSKDDHQGSVSVKEGHVFFVAAGTALQYSAASSLQVFEAISGEMMNRDGDVKR